MSEVATTQLSSYLGVPVKVGNIDIEWFNRLVLEGLYLEDQDGKILFESNHVSAAFEIMPLTQGKFVFTTVRLFGFNFNLRKQTSDSPLNLQFVIDAFASKDTTRKSPDIDLRFNTILIRKGNFNFDVDSAPETPGKFNAKHVGIKNLSAKIALKAFNKDSVNAHIKKMSFEESSGFALNKLSLNLVANRDSAFLQDFEIRLPQTDLKIARARIDLTQVDSLPAILDNAPIDLDIATSRICLQDLSPFVPAFRNFTDTIELSAEATGWINNFDLKRITLLYGDKMIFVGNMELKNITHPDQTYVLGQVSKMYITTDGLAGLANNFSDRPVRLPDPVIKLGTINFTGEISGFFDNLVAFGKLSSPIGSIQTDLIFGSDKEKDIALYLKGRIISSNLNIHEILKENNPFGNVCFDINLDARRPVNGYLSGKITANINEFDFRGYKYENIDLSGNFKKNAFDGKIQVDNPNGALYAEGIFQHQGKNSLFNFTARLDHFRPDSLRLIDTYEAPLISAVLSADFTGDNIDNVEGSLRIDSLSFQTTPHSFFLKQFEVVASGHSQDRHLAIHSDILNGEVTGSYSFATLIPSLMNTMKGYVPALINVTQKKHKTDENNFSLLLTIENTEAISNTLKLPFTMIQQGRVTGHYNNIYNKFRVEAWLPKFRIGQSRFESGYLSCDNPNEKVDVQVKAINYNDKGLRNYLDLKVDAKDNRVNTLIGWANNKESLFKADLSTSILFVEEKDEKGPSTLRTEITLNESPLIVKDTLWTINPADITIRKGKIGIRDFKVGKEEQFLTMDGIVSNDPLDTLLVNLNHIELSYIFDVLNIPVLQFGGEATGKINANDLFNSRMLNIDLEVQNFSFNQVNLGRLNLFSEWDDTQKGILMLGSIYKNDSTWTDVNGYIFPVGPNDGLSLHFDANDINLAFLRPFVKNVVKDLQGRGFGSIHLHGPFSDLNVEGDAYVLDGGVGVDFLNTYYTFSDSVHLDKSSVNLQDITIQDKLGNAGKLSLKFNHSHFRDFSFQVDLQANNMLLYDVPEKRNPMIYGTVFGSGAGQIKGNDKLVTFDVNMKSDPKTAIYLDFLNKNTAADYDFITFVDKSKLVTHPDSATTHPQDLLALSETEEGAEIRANFLFDITPDAHIELIMDPISDDRIKGKASGPLQIQYGNRSDLRMYGDVNIVEGNYNFSLQQIIRKDFKIRDGSTINFRGDPLNANMNVSAMYSLSANIGDLDETLARESARTNVPVNCIMKLDGALRTPAISFDLELPGSNEELERQVKSLVDTEDMMTRQIVYLLVLNKFYTPEYLNGYKSSELNAVASSAISTQLSSILNSFTDKVQIGTNIHPGQNGLMENTEYEMLLSSQLLDNRLLINGNFGVRNGVNLPKNTFIGEFDLEYKLTKSGDIRLKAYNHARDLYYGLKQALTVQGAGIMYKRDFTSLWEIFKKRRRLLLPLAPVDSTQVTPAIKDSTILSPPIDKP